MPILQPLIYIFNTFHTFYHLILCSFYSITLYFLNVYVFCLILYIRNRLSYIISSAFFTTICVILCVYVIKLLFFVVLCLIFWHFQYILQYINNLNVYVYFIKRRLHIWNLDTSMIKTKSTSSPLQGLHCHGSTTLDVKISFLWYQIPAVATASIRMQSFFVSQDTATTMCRMTATDTTTI